MKQIAFRLNHICQAQFGLRTRAGSIIKTFNPEKKTREQIRLEIEDPFQAERLRQIQLEEDAKNFKQYIYNLKQNDSNPNNFIKVKVKNVEVAKTETTESDISKPFIVKKIPKQEKILISGIRRKVPASLRRLIPICRPLINMHLYQAQEAIADSGRKAAQFLAKTFVMVRSHAVQRGYDPERLYVHSIQVGRYKKFRKARFHAKARINPAFRETSQIKVILEERPTKEMFKDFVQGKTPSVISYLMKDQLVREKGDYAKIRRFQLFLTSKGRQQQKLMLKRRAQKEMKEKGLSFKYLHRQIVEQEAEQLAENYDTGKSGLHRFNLEARQTLFKKNEEINN
ncbi:unnamed protein product (macronuclear) [Paramecium tetraurelia]|uniref:Uncharacterized protein n=1 Tax=Paramecium tetraurelia TaxID=5888 RepID=A0DFM4_PARTE|nr:uncharacterized protein GSPATT00016654001 [Paramecium tetraurelia]CAK81841.1 unnamed protein product [Paramecium tetraurelia]|eukprot:XP_001449238.1 hypothetical protein (macronuclear) [Paramecium tetraurelia strain d4-2]